jgi:hypothetical protein
MRLRLVAGIALATIVCAEPRVTDAQAEDRTSSQAVVAPVSVPALGRTFFPGSVSVNSGLASPLEAENVVTYYAVEQGFTLFHRGSNRVIPYITLSGSGDRAGFDWNNKVIWQTGVKWARGFQFGVVQFGAGYAHETRFASDISERRATWQGSYWFGWSGAIPSRRSRRLWSGFPGSSWSVVGTPAPTEHDNFIGMWSIEQGVRMAVIAGVGLIPFVEQTLTIDSAGRPWNNRNVYGEGLKIRVPVGRGTLEAAGVYKHERRWIEQRTAAGLTASANLWYGWDPSRSH